MQRSGKAPIFKKKHADGCGAEGVVAVSTGPQEVKFVRPCQEVQPGKWVVVDVSVDGILGVPPTYIASRLRPSGCLIEKRKTSSCKLYTLSL
jgi:hypothetical protein